MANDEPKQKPPPEDDPIQSALDAVERATGEKLAKDECGDVSPEPQDRNS